MRRLPVLGSVAVIVCAAAFARPACAVYGELTSPRVAFSKEYPAAARARVNAVLDRRDCKFLGGSFLNSWTTLRYAGDPRALNLFLGDLVKCPRVTVHVSFKKLPSEVDWRVGHMAPGNRFQVEVNLDSPHLHLEELYIPEYTAPK